MNKVIMMGRVVADLTNENVRYTSGDNPTCIANFRIAVDKRFKNKNNPDAPTADFFRITAFGKLGEFCKNYLGKGTKVVVEGRIENDNYTDSNGNKVFRDQIIAENIEFAESKKAQESNGSDNAVTTADASAASFMNTTPAGYGDLPFK